MSKDIQEKLGFNDIVLTGLSVSGQALFLLLVSPVLIPVFIIGYITSKFFPSQIMRTKDLDFYD